MRLCLVTLAFCLPLAAADTVVLDSGFRIDAQKVEREGGTIVLHTGSGRIEFDAARVVSIEHTSDPVPPAPSAVPTPAPVKQLTPRELVTEAAKRHGLPPEIVHSVAQSESAYRADAVSPKGAVGVMQLMPGTARMLNADERNLEQNIDAGTRLLRELLLKYQNDPNPVRRALAAYNAGEGAVKKYNGVPPYRETQNYVERVIERYWKQIRQQKKATAPATAP